MDKISLKSCPVGFLRVQFDTEYRAKHFDMNLFFYRGKDISHYTDLHGLFGILESGGFWLSDHRFLNDSEEFENGRKLTQYILNELSRKPCHKKFSHILGSASQFINNYEEQPYYVCSFSKDPDSLDQWRSYTNDGNGISITFDNSREGLSHFFIMPIMSISKVIYSNIEKSIILIRTIRKHEKEYLFDKKHGYPIDDECWVSEVSTSLVLEFMNFKHPAFESEKEVRLVVAAGHLHHFKGLKYRVSKGSIIPYLTTSDLYDDSFQKILKNSLLPIKSIHVGPTSNQEMTIKSIEEYLLSKGYNKVKVMNSKVPYRG